MRKKEDFTKLQNDYISFFVSNTLLLLYVYMFTVTSSEKPFPEPEYKMMSDMITPTSTKHGGMHLNPGEINPFHSISAVSYCLLRPTSQ